MQDLAFHDSFPPDAQEWLKLAIQSSDHNDQAYNAALQRVQDASDVVEGILRTNNIDVLIGYTRTGKGGGFSSVAGGGGLPIVSPIKQIRSPQILNNCRQQYHLVFLKVVNPIVCRCWLGEERKQLCLRSCEVLNGFSRGAADLSPAQVCM